MSILPRYITCRNHATGTVYATLQQADMLRNTWYSLWTRYRKGVRMKIRDECKYTERMGTRVFTDGSAVRNGSPNACGGIGVWFADDSPFNIAEGFTSTPDNKVTNQSMELIAGIMALESIEENDMDKPITLCTDSEYVINCVKWAPGWKKSGWLTKLRRPVLNRELIERLVELVESTGCILVHVMSHQTLPDDPSHPNYPYIYGNSRADELAKEGASAALKSTRKQ